MANLSPEILERNLAAAGPGFIRPADYAVIHGLTRSTVDYYITARSLRMPDGSDAVRRVNNNFYVHKDAVVERKYKPRARFNFGRKAVCVAMVLCVYNPVYASDYVILNDGQQTVIDHAKFPVLNQIISTTPLTWTIDGVNGGGGGGTEVPLHNNSFSYSLPRPYVSTPALDPDFGPTLTPAVQQHVHRPLIFKQKHPVFWKTTAPWRRFVWHPMVMVGKKSGFNKIAVLASDSFIKMGEITEPYHAGGTTVNTVLGLAATCGLFLKR